MFLWSVPVPPEVVLSFGRYDALVAGSVVLVLFSQRAFAEAVWERGRCGGRGGWLPLEGPGVPAGALLGHRSFVIPARGRAVASLEGVLRRVAPVVGLSPGGSVVREALRRFPPGEVGALALALAVMED